MSIFPEKLGSLLNSYYIVPYIRSLGTKIIIIKIIKPNLT